MITENFKEIKDMGENIKKLVYKQYQKRELTLLTLKKEEREMKEKISGDINEAEELDKKKLAEAMKMI